MEKGKLGSDIRKLALKWAVAAILLVVALLPAQGAAVAAQQGCASPLEPGAYRAAFTQQFVATSAGAGGVVVETIIDGRADLQINCEGNITGTFKGSAVNTTYPQRVITTFHAAIVLLGEEAKCVLYGDYNLTSGTVTVGDNGAPRIVLTFSASGGQSECSGSDALLQLVEGMVKSPGGPTSHTWTWQAEEWDPTFAHGQSPFGDPTQEAAMSGMAQGGDVSQQQQWLVEKSEEEPVPVVTDMARRYDYIFLEHVSSVLNLYTATIDWQNQEPGTVSFAIDGQPLESKLAVNTASAELQIDLLDAGKHTLSVVATSAKGKTSAPYEQPITVVPVPAWAKPYELKAVPQDGYVLYQSTTSLNLPSEPLDFTISVPKQVPYLSGEWGLKKVQVQTNLSASSATGPSNSQVSGNGALALAGKDLALTVPAATSFMRTNLQPEGLQLQAGQATFELPVTEYTKKLGLQDFIPGISLLYQQPKIGAALQALDVSLVSATIRNKLHGIGTLGVVEDRVKFTGGSVTDDADIFLTAGPNFADTVFLLAVAGANASLTVDLALPPHATDCWLNAYAYVLYGAFGYVGTFPEPVSSVNLLSCKDFAERGTGPVLAAPVMHLLLNEAQMSVQPRSAAWQPEQSLDQPVTATDQQGVGSTTLVENASALWASPVIAAGPGGQLAMAWISEMPGRERPQAWQAGLRIFDGKSWGPQIALSDDVLPDYTPTLAFDGAGQVVAAWVKSTHAEKGEGPTQQEFLTGMEIAYAVVDPKGSIVSSGALTNDTALDFSPQLAAGIDGAVWLAWEQSPAGNFIPSESAPNALMLARWHEGKWSAVEQASDALGSVINWRLAAHDAATALVVGTARDDNTSGVFVFEHTDGHWLARRGLASGLKGEVAARATYASDGKPAVAWSSEEGITGVTGDLQGTPAAWLTGTATLNNIMAGSAGDLALVFSSSGESGKPALNVAKYAPDSSRWSASASIYTGPAGVSSFLSSARAVTGSGGDLAMVFAEPLVQGDRSAHPQAGGQVDVAPLPELASIKLVLKPGLISSKVEAPVQVGGKPADVGWLAGGAAGAAGVVFLFVTALAVRNRKRTSERLRE